MMFFRSTRSFHVLLPVDMREKLCEEMKALCPLKHVGTFILKEDKPITLIVSQSQPTWRETAGGPWLLAPCYTFCQVVCVTFCLVPQGQGAEAVGGAAELIV